MAECAQAVDRLCRQVGQVVGADGPQGAHLRNAVERCLLARVGPVLWRSYTERSADVDAAYARRTQALAAVPDGELLEALEVPPRFRGVPESFEGLRVEPSRDLKEFGAPGFHADSVGSDTVSTAADAE